MKTIFWRVLALIWLTLAAPGSFMMAAPAPGDPLVGNWLWRDGNEVTFNADGSATVLRGQAGAWVYLNNPEVQRHYRIVWGHGQYIDTLACSEDGQSGHVHNQNGMQYNVRRAIETAPAAASPVAAGPAVASPAAVKPVAAAAPGASAALSSNTADPVIGEWSWHGNLPIMINADGTVTHPDGLGPGSWEFLHNPEPERQYRILWNNGKSYDLLFWTPGTRTARVTSKSGHTYEAHPASAGMVAPAKTKGADFFGAPK